MALPSRAFAASCGRKVTKEAEVLMIHFISAIQAIGTTVRQMPKIMVNVTLPNALSADGSLKLTTWA